MRFWFTQYSNFFIFEYYWAFAFGSSAVPWLGSSPSGSTSSLLASKGLRIWHSDTITLSHCVALPSAPDVTPIALAPSTASS